MDIHIAFASRNSVPKRYETLAVQRGLGVSGELGPFTFIMDVVPGGLQLATVGAEDRYVLAFQVAGTMSVNHGGAQGTTQSGRTAAIFSLMRPGTCDIAPGSSQRGVIIERKVVDDHLRKLTGAQPRHPVLFDPLLNLESAAGARLNHLVSFAAMETQRPAGVDASPLFARGPACRADERKRRQKSTALGYRRTFSGRRRAALRQQAALLRGALEGRHDRRRARRASRDREACSLSRPLRESVQGHAVRARPVQAFHRRDARKTPEAARLYELRRFHRPLGPELDLFANRTRIARVRLRVRSRPRVRLRARFHLRIRFRVRFRVRFFLVLALLLVRPALLRALGE